MKFSAAIESSISCTTDTYIIGDLTELTVIKKINSQGKIIFKKLKEFFPCGGSFKNATKDSFVVPLDECIMEKKEKFTVFRS